MKRFPHPLALLAGCILLATLLTWIVPAGRYERRDDAATGRSVVVPGTYRAVEAAPVGPMDALLSIPKGMINAADVIFLVLIAGGAFVVVDKTGTLRRVTEWLASRLERRAVLVIPMVSLSFAAGGAFNNMAEEIIPLVPVLLLLSTRLGFDAMVAVSMSMGAAIVGAAFSPFNPFQVLIGQRLAELPPGSGWPLRLIFLVIALAIWIGWTMRYANRTRQGASPLQATGARPSLSPTDAAILLVIGATFAVFVTGMLRWHWNFEHISAVFFAMGVLAGLIGRLGVSGTAAAYAEGFGAMAYAGALIGFARAIFVVLDQGAIIDTLVHGLFMPIEGLPAYFAAVAMMTAHVGIHVPVPSVSGQAVLTMPVLVPLSDLIGLSRQATVTAYHLGAGLADLLTPTNGALMAVIGAAGVGYDQWVKFAMPRFLALLALGALALAVATVGG